MSASRQQEKALFEQLLDLSGPGEREAFLDRSCRDQPALRRRLERLLAAQAPADAFLGLRADEPRTTRAAQAAPASATEAEVFSDGSGEDRAPLDSPVLIGRYKLRRRLGEGGWGVVYLAEQQEPVRREVALKIIRLGMDTENIIARFEMERQALALMDHPNIARVLDAGATGSGRPFFVMELVRGIRITDYCDEHRLSVPRRLELFVQVCHAIQHAHQKGILHRDIKPSNILVALHDGVAVPKVIDFGIAKAVEGRLGADTAVTANLQLAGTPAYMSPEQADPARADIDTRSDIYGLGALLHELLVGRPPFDSAALARAGLDEMRRIIREHEPARPSARLVALPAPELKTLAARHGAEPARLVQAVRDDLDWIVMRCLEKDRRRRYETAYGLAMDVRRHLDHEPVAARPPSRLYRIQKLVRRNQVVCVAGLLVFLALVAGLGASTWLFLRERDARREQARLRDEAELARAAEVALRLQAEAREKITQAAILVNRGDIDAAEALVGPIPRDQIRPSLEAADVFGALGRRHALRGSWALAAERYAVQASVILVLDDADTDDISRHLMPAASAILEAGNVSDYERFRSAVLARFAGTAKPIPAEQITKVCLLVPADPAALRAFAPLAEIVAVAVGRTEPSLSPDPYMDAWRCFALALHEFRRGDHERALTWADLSVGYPNTNTPRYLSVRFIRAMALHSLGREAAARDEWEKCRRLLVEGFPEPLAAGSPEQGFWFDWVNARILRREADALIGP